VSAWIIIMVMLYCVRACGGSEAVDSENDINDSAVETATE